MRRGLLAGLGSLVVHGVVLLALLGRPPPAPLPPPEVAPATGRALAFTVLAPAAEEAVASRAEPSPPPPSAVRPELAPGRRRTRASKAHPVERPTGPPPSASEGEGPRPSVAPPERPSLVLEPGSAQAALDLRLPLAAPAVGPPPASERWLAPVVELGRTRPPDAPPAAPEVELRREGSALVARAGRMEARIDADGELELIERSSGPMAFDLTELLMSARGEDALAHHRRVLLEATREERRARADAACETRLQTSVLELERALEAIWADPARTPVERRRLIFELWDECAEEGSPAVLRASALARATIESFVRRRLPAGGPDAYPVAELALLDRHRLASRRFDPYRAVTSTAAGAR